MTALTGARPPELEELVTEHDIALVAADPESPLARAAIAALAGRGVAAAAQTPLRRGLARTLALAGIAAPRLDLARLDLAGLDLARLALAPLDPGRLDGAPRAVVRREDSG